MTISRRRKHITNYYGNEDVGKFPEKNKPITMNSDIDCQGELLNFRDTNDLLESLILSTTIYLWLISLTASKELSILLLSCIMVEQSVCRLPFYYNIFMVNIPYSQ